MKYLVQICATRSKYVPVEMAGFKSLKAATYLYSILDEMQWLNGV